MKKIKNPSLQKPGAKWFLIIAGLFLTVLVVNAVHSILRQQMPLEAKTPLKSFTGPYHCEESSKPSPIPPGANFSVEENGSSLTLREGKVSYDLFREEDGDFLVQGTDFVVTFSQDRAGMVFGLSAREGGNVFLKASKPLIINRH